MFLFILFFIAFVVLFNVIGILYTTYRDIKGEKEEYYF